MSLDADTVDQALALAQDSHVRKHVAELLEDARTLAVGHEPLLKLVTEIARMVRENTCNCASNPNVQIEVPTAAEIEARRLELTKPMRKRALVVIVGGRYEDSPALRKAASVEDGGAA